MNICFFTENYYQGGLDTFLINLINAWHEEEDKFTLVCNASHPGLESIEANVKRTFLIKCYNYLYTTSISQGQTKFGRFIPIRAFFVLSHIIIQYPFLFGWYIITLTSFFRKSSFDRLMVINGGYPASLLGRCAIIAWVLSGKKNKAVFNFHNSTAPSPWYFRLQESVIDNLLIKNSSHIVSVSKACLNSLHTRESFVDCNKLSFIYNGLQAPVINEASNLDKSQKPYCLMLATYEPRKGHHYLLKAFSIVTKEYPGVKLKIFGYVAKPHEMNAIVAEVNRLSLEDQVELNQFTQEKNQLIKNASILVVPSQENESFGLTIIEAMALGTPVVTTDVGGMPEVLEGTHAGFVCSKDNPEEFAAAMIKILRDPALAIKLSRNGIEAFNERYSAEKMAAQYNRIIKM
jgi:glycosyltransferase involved in cell wall biosynthesis